MSFPSPPPNGSLMLAWQVNGRRVLVVGGGEVAASRVYHLLGANADITVVASHAGPELTYRARNHQITLVERPFETKDLCMYEEGPLPLFDAPGFEAALGRRFALVMVAISDHELLREIYLRSRAAGIPANIADVPPLCDFYFGLVLRNGPLQVMVSTNGKLPRLAALLRRRIEKEYGEENVDVAAAIERLGELRARIRATDSGIDEASISRRMEWAKAVTDSFSVGEWAAMQQSRVDAMVEGYPALPHAHS